MNKDCKKLKSWSAFICLSLAFCLAVVLLALFWKRVSIPGEGPNVSTKRIQSQQRSSKNENQNNFNHNKKTLGITPLEARRILSDQAKKILNIEERAELCASVIERLCKGGYSSEAWDLIELGAGRVRIDQVDAFFAYANITNREAIEKILSLDYKPDASIALRSYLGKMDVDEIRNILMDPTTKELLKELDAQVPNRVKMAVFSALEEKIITDKDISSKNYLMQSAIDFYAGGLISADGFVGLLKWDNSRNSFQKFATMNDIVDGSATGSESMAIRKEIIAEMIVSDAPQAMKHVTSVESNHGLLDLHSALIEWAHLDSVASAKWYTDHHSDLSPAQRDTGAMAFFKLALDFGEFDGARRWAQYVSDPDIRARALEILASKLPKIAPAK